MGNQLGKLIRTLSDPCPDCGHKLQLRHIEEASTQKGIALTVIREVKQCPLCEYEEDIQTKKRKEQVGLKDSFTAVKAKEVSKNGRYPKRGAVKDAGGKSGGRSSRGNNR